MARSTRTFGWLIALLVATACVGWFWLLGDVPSAARNRAAKRERAATPADERLEHGTSTAVPPRTPANTGRPSAPPAGACKPQASRSCREGDVYWIDSCGQRGDKADECGARLCKGDACEPAEARACAGLPLEGRCDGDVVRGCLAGWPFERDCRALGKRCVIGDEGAVCRRPSEDDCDRYGALPRCEGGKLIACFEGKRVVRDCAAMNGARCEVLAQTKTAACVATRELDRPPRDKDPCGPCGCPNGAPDYGDEKCNGSDDDGDSFIDEDVSCEPVEVVAYVINDDSGASSYAREDIEEDIARANTVFATGGGLPLRVKLAGVVDLAQPNYLTVDDDNFSGLLAEVRHRASATGLQIPVVFTDEIISEDAPKAGLSTIPNGTCGGVRRSLSPQPALGMVVVAKRRAPTTVAHELGHFLGLCHTHEADPPAVVQTARYRDASGGAFRTTCDPSCGLEGDGICDTAFDPGPESCGYDLQCSAHCAGGEAPSTHNLMSYYTECRDRLTPEQTIEINRSRALLEGFYRCSTSECPCVPGALDTACPEQMSCRPGPRGTYACTLDGAFYNGESCKWHRECGAGLVCANGRCAPPPLQ